MPLLISSCFLIVLLQLFTRGLWRRRFAECPCAECTYAVYWVLAEGIDTRGTGVDTRGTGIDTRGTGRDTRGTGIIYAWAILFTCGPY